MNNAAAYIESVFTGHPPLQAEVNGDHYWEIAKKNQQGKFIVYRIIEETPPTKDRREFLAKVYCFAPTLTEAADISELVKDAFEGRGHYRGGTSGFTDEEKKEGFIEQNFNFKL